MQSSLYKYTVSGKWKSLYIFFSKGRKICGETRVSKGSTYSDQKAQLNFEQSRLYEMWMRKFEKKPFHFPSCKPINALTATRSLAQQGRAAND